MKTKDLFIMGLRHVIRTEVLKQKAIAESVKISDQNFSGILAGRRPCSLKKQEEIAAAIGMSHFDIVALGKELEALEAAEKIADAVYESAADYLPNPKIKKILQILRQFDRDGDEDGIDDVFRSAKDRADRAAEKKRIECLEKKIKKMKAG